jgi:hypothetical protein
MTNDTAEWEINLGPTDRVEEGWIRLTVRGQPAAELGWSSCVPLKNLDQKSVDFTHQLLKAIDEYGKHFVPAVEAAKRTNYSIMEEWSYDPGVLQLREMAVRIKGLLCVWNESLRKALQAKLDETTSTRPYHA